MRNLMLLITLLSSPALAASATGEMEVTIFSTRNLNLEDLEKFCEEFYEAVQCEELVVEQEDEETGKTYELPVYQVDLE